MANQTQTYISGGNQIIEPTSTIQSDPFIGLASPVSGYSFPNSPYIKLGSREVTFSVNTLGNTTHTYTSPLYQDIIALAKYFADWSCAYTIKEGPQHTLVASIPWDTMSGTDFSISLFASEQWELTPVMDTKPLIVNGILPNSFNDPSTTCGQYVVLPQVLQLAVQKCIDKSQDIVVPVGSYYGSASLAPYFPYAQKILNYTRGGIEGVAQYTQVLKRTAVVDRRNSNAAFMTAADTLGRDLYKQGTVNYILSTQDILNYYDAIPEDSVGQFLLPSYSKKLNITSLDPVTYTAYAGWLVKPISVQFIGRNKIQLTQEFIWNEWPSGLYYIESSPSDFGTPFSNPVGSTSCGLTD